MAIEIHPYWKLFKPAACATSLRGSQQEAIFAELVSNLVKAKELPGELEAPAVQALVERERLASTGVGLAVAVPHVKLDGLERAALSLSIHAEGVEWRAIDGRPVHLVFTVLRPAGETDQHDPERHLDMMRWISRLARHDDFRKFALRASTKKELVDLLREMSAV